MSSGSKKKVAMVTGASSGIGKAIVQQLLKEGWIVYGAARRVEKMADIEAMGAKVLPLDVTDDASMTTAVQTLLTAEGQIDALVNNAGYGSYGALEDVPLQEAKRQFDVNVFGLMRLTQLVLPSMRTAKSGTIVNISSMGGRIWMPIGGWYHATKHAVEVLSDALRMETEPFGIRVVVVQPGAIESEWSSIAAQTLRENSQGSAYQSTVEPMAKVLEDYQNASSPNVVAKAVSKAVNSRHPKRRYATPMDAKLYIFLHWLLPDWAWERLIASAIQ
ncbi:MAG: oxidoreductase [Coleofasciculus sp. B1-GNL1-01]|uniref:oxidoreductase n=1 Tax=Coleofasciculus sp. B1-GNL1-01 TaxID=3068484 RepID=UPI0032FDBBC5